MPVTSHLRYLRIAPRKVRLMAGLVRKKKAEEAQTILRFATKKASRPLLKLLNQAIASAKGKGETDIGNLFVSKIMVDEGPKYKRWRAQSRGQAHQIQKKTSHITLVLEEIEKKKARKKARTAGPAEKIEKAEKVEKEEKVATAPKAEKPKPRPEWEEVKPKTTKGLGKIFRRKAI